MSAFLKEIIHFPSSDGRSTVAGFLYRPVYGSPKAVIQLSHGMCEYIERYEPMIEVLCQNGFAVAGNDHLGHGSTGSSENYGFFSEKEGYRLVLEDLLTMNRLIHKRFPELQLILLGHSMGSFYARWFAEKNPEAQDALIISGTGGPNPLMGFGLTMAKILCRVKGPRYVSDFMVKASTGSYCKGLEQDANPHAWLSRNPTIWVAYGADPKCTFPFTVSAYRDMLTALVHVNTRDWAQQLRKDLPVYIYSGDFDPVGDYGKGVTAVYKLLKDAGQADVTLRLYPDGRHEMHNELNKEEVFADLIAWCDAHLGGAAS